MRKDVKKTSIVKRTSKKKKAAVPVRKVKKFFKDVKSANYQDYLIETLKDPEEAAGYLNAALSGGDIRVFLLALQNVVQAQGGVTMLSEKTHKSRTSLYKSLSEDGNPYLKSANELLTAMGMHLAVVPNNPFTQINQHLSH
jgi:probable addiction module antidote protein